ncbi:MAG: hypothetical protein RSF37_10715 [Clostridium sp.]|uniref:hypothetical protein n=1 Tax=Clostridium sp. TaxID=1506 RepID=UPI002FC624B5
MQIKKWENPEVLSLNSKDTKNPDGFHYPTAWHCPTCGPVTATPVNKAVGAPDGPHSCDVCKKLLYQENWVGDGNHPS